MNASTLLPNDADRRRGIGYWITLVSLVILAAIPRLYHLGIPGFSGNEDYAMLSARAILDEGVPRFPSGVVYPRALIVSYGTAASTWLFGENEFAGRLPWALLSALGVGLAYLLARRVFGREAALIAGLVLALSAWDITTARTARMYGPLSFAFLAAIYTMHKVVFEDNGRFRIPNLMATVAACSLHQLGAMLVVPYGAAFLLGKSGKRRGFIALAIAVVIAAAGVDILFEQKHYSGFQNRAQAHVAGIAKVDEEAHSDDEAPRGNKLNALSPFGRANLRNSQISGFIVLFVGLAAAVLLRNPRWSFATALITTIVLVALQQLALAFYAVVAFLGWLAFVRKRWSWLEVTVLSGVLAVGAVFWLGFMVAGPPHLSPVRALRAIAGFPPNFLEIFARRSPAEFAVVVVAIGTILVGYFRNDEAFAPQLLVVAALALSATALGFHPSASRYFNERYVFQLHSFLVILFGAGAWWLATWGARLVVRDETRARQARTVALMLALGVTFAIGAISPLTTRAATLQHYGKNARLHDAGNDWFNPDHAGPSAFVCNQAAPGDAIVPMDILIHYVYCPRAVVQLTMSHKGDAEGWIGVRSVDSLNAVASEIEKGQAQRVWMVLSGDAIRQYREKDAPHLASALAFTGWDCARRAYEGRDGLSDVWVMDRECLLRHASE